MNNIVTEINERLKTILDNYPDSKVKEAMYYSLLAGGKRIRPLMMLQVIRSKDMDYHPYLDVACAIEMIHTYSLIHDDLPGMDNDDFRRGQLTCHKKYGEATAILAGDGLLNEAVNIIINANIDNDTTIKLINCLYSSSGINGMILGQELDMENETQHCDLETLNKIHLNKTGMLISASLQMGAIVADYNNVDVYREIGQLIGLAFQIQDDVLDVTSSIEVLGKKPGSDLYNEKSTYVSLLGIEKSQNEINKLFKKSYELIYRLRINHGLLLEIFEKLKERVS